MSDNKDIAKTIITEAAKTILMDRPGVHGPTENSFYMIGEMWTTYLRHVHEVRGNDDITAFDVANMMVQMKQARSIYGNSQNRDNYVDQVGYAALAGMLITEDKDVDQKPTTERQASNQPAVQGDGGTRDN